MDGNQSKASDSQFISFQDFPSINHEGNITQAQLDINTTTHQGFNNLSSDTSGIGIIEDLQGMPDKDEANSSRNFWTIEYYQKFFNVKTNDVVERIKRSMFPHGSENYLISHIRPNPDLYGPFWICVTLIFSIAISGNLADYLQTANSSKYHWRYEFHIVSYAATCIFLYAWLLPLTLWGALKWTTNTRDTEEELIESYATPGLLELICLYGYSLAIYIPVAFFWTIQIEWLQWSLVVVATFLSGGVLLRSLLPLITGRYRIMYIVIILGMHLLLAIGFMRYFFHIPSKTLIMEHITQTQTEIIGNQGANNHSG
ncbi:protein YIPF1 [Apis mellifera caucasica]|uniref:Protein YIPF n=1 Tax=Apis mellifera TaxID=7460 RepID=A0A7M7FYG7_APIME|nr:protein YIPF1 [Apis mellifera]KAG6803408.1 protein YIPF1 [Apis mellifera caucasica]KAG9435370.1 protein YIPF1 [Apis mellifera carnica]|eukprot:XP_001121218.1 protein YIPF1 [Apis mellifera]